MSYYLCPSASRKYTEIEESYQTLNSKLNISLDESLKLQSYWFPLFLLFFDEQTSQQLVIRLFGCCYFKSCRCWMWCGSDTHARGFIHALIWNDTGYRACCRICACNWRAYATSPVYSGWQDREFFFFYWHMAWQHLIWLQVIDVLLELLCHLYCFCARLTWAWCWGEVVVHVWEVYCLMWS